MLNSLIKWFHSFAGGITLGVIISSLINLVELGAIIKVMRDVRCLIKQFKAEGESDKWLK